MEEEETEERRREKKEWRWGSGSSSNNSSSSAARRLRVLMVCDFFYPSLGGVETHIYSVAQHLIQRGHKIVIVTHAYNTRALNQGADPQSRQPLAEEDDQQNPSPPPSPFAHTRQEERVGVRYMSRGLKVYYIPLPIMMGNLSFPLLLGLFPVLRNIIVRERIDLVHGYVVRRSRLTDPDHTVLPLLLLSLSLFDIPL